MADLTHTSDQHTRDIESLRELIDKSRGVSQEDFDLLKGRVDKLENMIQGMHKKLQDMEKKLKGVGGGGADQDMVDRLADELARLRSDFENYSGSTDNRLMNIENILPIKADKTDLSDLQNSILDKLRDMI